MTTSHGPSRSFGALLRHHRRALGLTQRDLARQTSHSVAFISMLERGTCTPVPATAERLAHHLDLLDVERGAFIYAAASTRNQPGHDDERAGANTSLPSGNFLGAAPYGPLVARDMEMRTLRKALTLALDGMCQLVMVVGEPGIDKTRLAQEATLQAIAAVALAATGRCCEPEQSLVILNYLGERLYAERERAALS
jgi:transcriptional regulator with XRE-family HTH domain